MSNHLNAQASVAGTPGTSTQEPVTSTSNDPAIGRNSTEQVNTQEEKVSDNALTYEEKVVIIRAAIEEGRGDRIKQWGVNDFSRLINHYEKGGVTPNQWIMFFTDLLFFIAKPEISSAFHKALPNGLDRISKQIDFFNELNTSFDDYAAWCDYRFIEYESVITEFDFNNIAEAWLEGADRKAVLDDAEGSGELKTMKEVMKDNAGKPQHTMNADNVEEKPAKTILDAANTVFRFNLNKITPIPLTMDPEEKKLYAFKNDQDLVAALDRYFPARTWPADKLTIASQQRMKIRLRVLEQDRIEKLTETAEQKTKRLVNEEVTAALRDQDYNLLPKRKIAIPVSPLPLSSAPLKFSGKSKAVPKKASSSVKKAPTAKKTTTKKKA